MPVSGYTQYQASAPCSVTGQWSTCYSYDPDGNLSSKTDNRGVVESYQYDGLNRPFSITSSNAQTLSACFLYDTVLNGFPDSNPIGTLSAEWTQPGACPSTASAPPATFQTSSIFSLHDAMGRVGLDSQCPYAPCSSLYAVVYHYDVAGNVVSSTNGMSGSSALTFTTAYDAAGRPSLLTATGTNSLNPTALLRANSQTASILGVPYSPFGAETIEYGVLSASAQAAITESETYDSVGHMTENLVQQVTQTGYPTDSITITGSDGTYQVCGRGGCVQAPNQGNIVITVGTFTASVPLGPITDGAVATAIATALTSASSPVTAVANVTTSGVVTLTSKVSGEPGEYAVSVSTDETRGTPTVFSEALSQPVMTNASSILYEYSVPAGGYTGDGNLSSHADSVTGTWNFFYDQLNRPTKAQATAGIYQGDQLLWSYDDFGNRLQQTPSGLSSQPVPAASSASYSAINQVKASNSLSTGFYYDAAGNVTSDGLNQYAYDGAGRLCAVYASIGGSVTGYIYDAGGNRTAKVKLSSLACPSTNITSLTNQYLLDVQNRQLTELNGAAQWQHSNVFSPSGLVATYDTYGLHFHFSDPLGSRRVQASLSASGAVSVDLQCASLPFGDGLTCTGSGKDATEQHFTGKERDSESGLDYFGARFYGSSMGRFMSPDPGWFEQADATNPQTWNQYAYVLNNPLTNTDPTGRSCQAGSVQNDDGTSTTVYSDDGDGKGCEAAGIAPDGTDKSPDQVNVNANSDSANTSSSGFSGFLSGASDAISNLGGQALNWLAAPRDPGCMAGMMAGGAAIGGVAGGIGGGLGGGIGGTLVAPGVGTIGGGAAGAVEGAQGGALVGGAAGSVVGFVACSSGGGGGGSSFGGNQRENKQANDAKRQAERETRKKFDRAQDRKFHDEITGQGYGYHELVEIAKGILEGHI